MTDDIKLPPLPDNDAIEEAVYAWTKRFVPQDTYDAIRHMMQEHSVAAIEADRQRRGEPVAFSYEVATTFSADGMYANWSPRLSRSMPNVPDDSIRNLQGLYASPQPAEPVELDRYDAGLLGGQDGMPAYVWHDIIRSELDRAYEFYMDQLDRAATQPATPALDPSDSEIMWEWANTPNDLSVFARAIEQAVLQSPEIQALRKDAERYRWLRDMIENQDLVIAKVGSWSLESWSGDDPDHYIDAAMEQQT